MKKSIDTEKLKAAAERLEWVLKEHADSQDIWALLHELMPLIAAAKAQQILCSISREDVPGAYNFADGVYKTYDNPSVDDAYTCFRIELRGGLTDQENRILSQLKSTSADAP